MSSSEHMDRPNTNDAPLGSLAEFRTDLDVFSGPLDLLLHLIKREEVDILEVPISQITDQYLQVLRALQSFNVNLAADFTVMAATLMEIKSRSLLPEPRSEEEKEEDPGKDLVRRLLQYKCFKDAASLLAERAKVAAQKFTRGGLEAALEPDSSEPVLLLKELDTWDLLTAYVRVLQQTQMPEPVQIVYDDVPVAAYMEEVLDTLKSCGGSVDFLYFFRQDSSQQRIIGIFLALLELVRLRSVTVTQTEGAHATLSLRPQEDASPVRDRT